MNRARLDAIMILASKRLLPLGLECIEAEWLQHDRILRLFVDRVSSADVPPSESEKTINLDACVAASRTLEDDVELDATINGAYTLEVSSPGIERPLRKRPCFERHVGAEVQAKLKSKVDGRWQGRGRLMSVTPPRDEGDAAIITLETPEGHWTFPLASLAKASLVYDWTSTRS